jgi:hypothetical protein
MVSKVPQPDGCTNEPLAEAPAEIAAVVIESSPGAERDARFHLLMGGVAGSFVLTLLALFHLESISIVNFQPFSVLQGIVPILVVAAYCHWAGFRKFREGSLVIAWARLFIVLLELAGYPAARTGRALVDQTLAQVDRFIGFDLNSIVNWTRSHAAFLNLSIFSYGLMQPFVFAAIVIPAIAGRVTRAREFLLSVIIAAILAHVFLALFPAMGPWTTYHFSPYWNQALLSREIAALRMPGPFQADLTRESGLIFCPSFHVALAVMSTYALWPLRWTRVPALAITALISMAIVTVGWHYVTDGMAGAITATLSILAGQRLVRRFENPHSQQAEVEHYSDGRRPIRCPQLPNSRNSAH